MSFIIEWPLVKHTLAVLLSTRIILSFKYNTECIKYGTRAAAFARPNFETKREHTHTHMHIERCEMKNHNVVAPFVLVCVDVYGCGRMHRWIDE